MKFPVFSLLAGNLAFSETSSQLTPPSSGESGANRSLYRLEGKPAALSSLLDSGYGNPVAGYPGDRPSGDWSPGAIDPSS